MNGKIINSADSKLIFKMTINQNFQKVILGILVEIIQVIKSPLNGMKVVV